jgi:hypothetical protein
MKRLVWGLLLILLVNCAAAATIADYPTIFFTRGGFNATVIRSAAGDAPERTAANVIINDLQRIATKRGLRATAVKASSTATTGNEIVIGTPCGSLRVRELLRVTAGGCSKALPKDQGLIKIIDDGRLHLLITGSDGDHVLDAAKVITDERQRIPLRVQSTAVVRKLYQKYYIGGGRKFLDIGQTIGAETPAIYADYPYVTYRPFNSYSATQYGAIVSTFNPSQRAGLNLPDGRVILTTAST